jgi:uncharacterized membrane protein
LAVLCGGSVYQKNRKIREFEFYSRSQIALLKLTYLNLRSQNAMKTVSIIMLILGLLLFGVGILFKTMNWPDMFYGLYLGSFLFMAGLILLISKRQKNKVNF